MFNAHSHNKAICTPRLRTIHSKTLNVSTSLTDVWGMIANYYSLWKLHVSAARAIKIQFWHVVCYTMKTNCVSGEENVSWCISCIPCKFMDNSSRHISCSSMSHTNGTRGWHLCLLSSLYTFFRQLELFTRQQQQQRWVNKSTLLSVWGNCSSDQQCCRGMWS